MEHSDVSILHQTSQRSGIFFPTAFLLSPATLWVLCLGSRFSVWGLSYQLNYTSCLLVKVICINISSICSLLFFNMFILRWWRYGDRNVLLRSVFSYIQQSSTFSSVSLHSPVSLLFTTSAPHHLPLTQKCWLILPAMFYVSKLALHSWSTPKQLSGTLQFLSTWLVSELLPDSNFPICY